MKCKFCGTVFEEAVCPNCGAPAPINSTDTPPATTNSSIPPAPPTPPPVFVPQQKVKKRRKIPFLIVFIIFFIFITNFLKVYSFLFLDKNHEKSNSTYSSSTTKSNMSSLPTKSNTSSTAESQSQTIWPPQPTQNFLTLSPEEYMAAAVPIDYEKVKRYPEQFIGVDLVLTVKITQIIEKPEGKLYIGKVQYPNGEFPTWESKDERRSGIYLFVPEGSPSIYDDDIVTVYGEFNEIRQMESFLATSFIPIINARYIVL